MPYSKTDIPEINLLEIPSGALGDPHSMYSFFDDMREQSPVVQMYTPEDRWITFLRAETAKTILQDTKTFKTFHPDANAGGYFQEELLPASKDPPDHGIYRSLLQKHLLSKSVKELETRMREFSRDLI